MGNLLRAWHEHEGENMAIDEKYQILAPSKGIDNNWHVTNEGDTCVAHCYGFGHSINEGKALAERIVACLNYCAGKSTGELLEEKTKDQQ